MRVSSLLALGFLLLPNAGAAQDQRLNGTWELLVDRSDFGRSPPPDSLLQSYEFHGDTIISSADFFHPAFGHRPSRLSFVADGVEHRSIIDGVASPVTASWERGELVIQMEVETNIGPLPMVTRVSVSEDGGGMTARRVIDSPAGELVQTMVFRKRIT